MIKSLVILMRSFAVNQTSLPSNRQEKEAFKASLGDYTAALNINPENVAEARREAHRAFALKAVPDTLEELLCSPATQSLAPSSTDFRCTYPPAHPLQMCCNMPSYKFPRLSYSVCVRPALCVG